MRTDQLSTLVPELFGRNMIYNRILFLHSFLINKPEYIEHVLLTNHANYSKSQFLRRMLGPVLGDGLLTSEGELWRRQRRIAAPAFHNKRIAGFVDTFAACTQATLARWRTLPQPFDVTAEMMALTLDIIARTMFSTDVRGEVEAVRRLMEIVVTHAPQRAGSPRPAGMAAAAPAAGLSPHRRAIRGPGGGLSGGAAGGRHRSRRPLGDAAWARAIPTPARA